MDNLKTNLVKTGINKKMIAIVAGVVVVAVIYFVFFKNNNSGPDTSGGLATVAGGNQTSNSGAPGASSDVQLTSQQFLNELLNIESIKIDNSIVKNKAFVVLQDLSRPIDPDNNPGRINPFAPLGAESATVSTQINTNDTTLKLATSAVLNGTLLISGQNVTRWFEYGPTDSLGTKTPETPQSTIGSFSENITGLLPNTKYYAKAVASISGQVISGALVSWTTSPLKRTQ